MGRLRRSRTHRAIRDVKRTARTRVRTRDLDLIHGDLAGDVEKLKNQPLNPDLPGLGQHYCVECAKYFIDGQALTVHTKSKVHRRRLKDLKDAPYTQKDADLAAGLAVDKRSASTILEVNNKVNENKMD